MQGEEAKIVLIIENRQPVQALALSELLAALARDYSKQNRVRTLVVTRVEDGSIWITLMDMTQAASPYAKGAVEAAKGVKAIIDFGKSLARLLNGKKTGQAETEQIQNKSPRRSVEKLLKLSVDANCNVRLRQVEADGSYIDVEVTPPEAAAIQESERTAKGSRALRTSVMSHERLPAGVRAIDIADEFERLQISQQLPVDGALQIILSIIKRSGDVKLLESLAVELEERGYKQLAAAIRNG
ncbi:hypothetical protein [Rhodovulum sulfidophilum]|uniref:hypothetical protein n=1 Tax=Rhodovulum sulfidophilum TaxID=35806 RepID=UPI001179D558|nr:hypothetical protein [Rhodovulum sulfidophilum]